MINLYVLIATLFIGFECLGMENNSRKRPLSVCLQNENFLQDSNQFQSLFNPDHLEQDPVCSPRLPEKKIDEQKTKKLKNNRLSGFDLSYEQIQEILKAQDQSQPIHIRLRQLSYKVQLQGANRHDAEKIKKRARNLI